MELLSVRSQGTGREHVGRGVGVKMECRMGMLMTEMMGCRCRMQQVWVQEEAGAFGFAKPEYAKHYFIS